MAANMSMADQAPIPSSARRTNGRTYADASALATISLTRHMNIQSAPKSLTNSADSTTLSAGTPNCCTMIARRQSQTS